MEIEWTETALDDMAGLDKGIARRVKQSVERFAETGAGNVKRLQGIDPPEFRLRVGDYRVRFQQDDDTMRILRVRNRREAYRRRQLKEKGQTAPSQPLGNRLQQFVNCLQQFRRSTRACNRLQQIATTSGCEDRLRTTQNPVVEHKHGMRL